MITTPKFHVYSPEEEVMSGLTHGIGAIIVSLGSGCLITLAALTGDAWKIVSVSIYCFSMILLYCASTLYHIARAEKAKYRLKIFDHASIYILIAGTYTPFLLVNLRGVLGFIMFGFVWAIAIFGVIFEMLFIGKYKKISIALYLGMGWIALFTAVPLYKNVPSIGLMFMLIGGLFYSGGVYFYARKDKKFFHGIWHLFVLAGTIMHFFSVLFSCI